MELYAFIASLPDRDSWQAKIDDAGLDLQLDPDLDLSRDSGFSPCMIRGRSSGFELWVTSAAEPLQDYPAMVGVAGDRAWSICFRWGGDFVECSCVMGATLALVKGFGAVAYDPGDEVSYDTAKLEEDLQACLAEWSAEG
jgi:hypothetical protein